MERISCAVPYCRRTAPADKFEPGSRIICGKHWRLGDERPRRAYSLAKKRLKATGLERYLRIVHNCWERVLRQAIERAAGITG